MKIGDSCNNFQANYVYFTSIYNLYVSVSTLIESKYESYKEEEAASANSYKYGGAVTAISTGVCSTPMSAQMDILRLLKKSTLDHTY
jgi:hypothetical protein